MIHGLTVESQIMSKFPSIGNLILVTLCITLVSACTGCLVISVYGGGARKQTTFRLAFLACPYRA